jgi:hypothetical protein
MLRIREGSIGTLHALQQLLTACILTHCLSTSVVLQLLLQSATTVVSAVCETYVTYSMRYTACT